MLSLIDVDAVHFLSDLCLICLNQAPHISKVEVIVELGLVQAVGLLFL